jgi:hypothetical protein
MKPIKLAQPVTFLTCNLEEMDSNLGRDTEYPDSGFS